MLLSKIVENDESEREKEKMKKIFLEVLCNSLHPFLSLQKILLEDIDITEGFIYVFKS